jgi:hypothetical protein
MPDAWVEQVLPQVHLADEVKKVEKEKSEFSRGCGG